MMLMYCSLLLHHYSVHEFYFYTVSGSLDNMLRFTIFSLGTVLPYSLSLNGLTLKVLLLIILLTRKSFDKLLANGTIETSIGGAGFYSNVFVVPKHSCGL